MKPKSENSSQPDWAPKGELPKNYFKLKSSAAPIVQECRTAQARPETRPISRGFQNPVPMIRKIPSPVIAPAPVTPADLGSDVVVMTCMVCSDLDKRQTGLWRATNEPSTRMICMAFKIGTALLVWSNTHIPHNQFPDAQLFTGPCPGPVIAAVNGGASFLCNELVTDRVMYVKQGWPEPVSWKAVGAPLAAANFKRNIMHAAEILLNIPSDPEDRQFIRGLWKRNGSPLAAIELTRAVALTIRRAQIVAALASKVGLGLGRDEEIYQLDSKINADGARVDVDLIRAAMEMNETLKATLEACANETLVKMRAKNPSIKAALNTLGIALPDMKVHTLQHALKSTNDFDAQLLLVSLLVARQTSSSKFEKVFRMVCVDGFLRGLYVYCQARTGRWSSEDTQVHNLKRTTLTGEEISQLIKAIKSGNVDAVLDAVPLAKLHEAICGLIRAVFIPRPGNCFLVADFKQIEVRVIFWLAGCGIDLLLLKTKDLYVTFANAIFGETPRDHPEFDFRRAVGKVGILGCQFGMGAAAFLAFCLNCGIDLSAKGINPKDVVDAFRGRFPRVKALWAGYQNAALTAITTSQPNEFGHCTFKIAFGALLVILPSGRCIIYHNARVEKGMYGDVLGYTHYKSKTHSVEVQAWGGKIAENICQAVARDAMADAMIRVSKAGFRTTLHTHDEIVCEALVEQAEVAEQQVKTLLEKSPEWASSLPMQVAIFRSDRYGKEAILE